MEYKVIVDNGMRYIVLPELAGMGLGHCFTTADMDMGIRTNPSMEDVRDNFRMISEAVGINPRTVFGGVQTHSKNVACIYDINQGEVNVFGRFLQDTDGFVTNMKDVALFTTYADCTPIILFDPVKKVHANVHSGWRGTLQRIGKEAVYKMVSEYSCNVDDIIAVIGPSIGKDDFEVESDVKEQFRNEFSFHNEIIRRKNDIKYLIDIQETNKRILIESGIKENNISTIDISTKSSPMLHSYRRDGARYGLMGCITAL